MKILQIHNYYRYRGGEDIVFDDLKAILSDKGIDVKVYARDSNNIKGHFQKLVSIFSLFYSIRAANDIKKIISDFKPDIAHIHNVYPLISFSILKMLKRNRIPVVQTTHNYRLFCANGLYLDRGKICEKCMELKFKNIFTDCRSESRLYNFLIALNIFFMRKRNQYSYIDRFIAPSGFIRDKIIESGIDSNKVEKIRSIIELPDLQKSKNNTGEPYFLYVGRLSTEKGIMEVIKVFEQIKDIKIKIVGDGPLKNIIEKKISQKKLENIELAGYIDGEEKYRIIRASTAVIIPSVCYEVSPLVIMESFKSGVPVIVNNIGSMPENIEEGKNGFIYRSLDDLKEKIRRLAKMSGSERDAMSESARESYDKHFSPEKNLDRLLALYKEMKQ